MNVTSPGHADSTLAAVAWPQEGDSLRTGHGLSYRMCPVIGMLLIQSALLVDSASRHTPTYLEPAFLASGLAHWEFDRFEPYRVNPPLVRMIAALPALAAGYKADWSGFYDLPGARSEFPFGDALVRANRDAVVTLIRYARWACIPFSLVGSYFAYRWAKELYGSNAGLLAMILFVFEPNLLAHGALITPDAACTALGIVAGYAFWRWLAQPTWTRVLIAGASLGLAELSKMSWLILLPLWPVLWVLWSWLGPTKSLCPALARSPSSNKTAATADTFPRSQEPIQRRISASSKPPVVQLIMILFLALYIVNLGYAFDGSGTLLKDFRFVSRSLTGLEPGQPGNRFRGTLCGLIPMPVPAQYVLGFDTQKKDFEKTNTNSYLRGQWSERGWWYYYVYGLLVKVPCGTWALLIYVLASRVLAWNHSANLRDEVVLLAPAAALMALVSSQTAFNTHLRYCFPALGLLLIFISQAGNAIARESLAASLVVCAAIVYSVGSSLSAYPNHLAYFNDFVGGPRNGHLHLLGSSLDWGQGVGEAIDWIKAHEPNSRVEFDMYSQTLARVLMGQELDRSLRKKDIKVPMLILYSAEHYWNRDSPLTMRPRHEKAEEVLLKQFDSGLVLVRVREPRDDES